MVEEMRYGVEKEIATEKCGESFKLLYSLVSVVIIFPPLPHIPHLLCSKVILTRIQDSCIPVPLIVLA